MKDFKNLGYFFIEKCNLKEDLHGVYVLEQWIKELKNEETNADLIDTGLRCAASFLGMCIIAHVKGEWVEEGQVRISGSYTVDTSAAVARQFFEPDYYSLMTFFKSALFFADKTNEIQDLKNKGLLKPNI